MSVTASGTRFTVSAETKRAKASMDTLSKSFKNYGSSVKTSSSRVTSFFSRLKKGRKESHNFVANSNRMTQSMKSFGGAVRSATRYFSIFMAMRAFANFINDASEMVEVANLFRMSMGSATTSTSEFVDQISEVSALDVTNIRSAVGVFGLLTRSMGFSADNAKVISENMYKLSLDLSSLTNAPIEQVLQNLKAGLVGQSEAVYKYGIDVTEASLKAEAMAQGISKSVRNMSQGEKMALRYSAMIKQTSLAQGDFARTINQPANQLRILRERLTTASRSLGSLFIPALEATLPYINAFVQLLTEALDRLARLVGYTAEPVRNLSDGFGEATGDIEETEDAVKSLQSTMGFDELNVIKDEEDSGTGATVGGADFQLDGYDPMIDTIKMKADKIA